MPITSTELTEVVVEQPRAVAVEGDYICTINYPNTDAGLMPNGSFVIFDTTTETARAFSGLNATTATDNAGSPTSSVVGAGGYFWTSNYSGNLIYRIDPATGSVSGLPSPGFNLGAGFGLAIGDYIFFLIADVNGAQSRRWTISTSTNTAMTGARAPGGVACSDGYLYLYDSVVAVWRKWDPVANSSVTTLAPFAACSGHGVEYGGYLWFHSSTGIVRLDPATFPAVGSQTTYSHTVIPGGNYATTSDLVLGADNWLYGYGASDYLIGFDPATGSFAKEALSPARGRRYTIASAGGKLWIPSGEPLT